MLKQAALFIPCVRRVEDGLAAMRAHIAALEADLASRNNAPLPFSAAPGPVTDAVPDALRVQIVSFIDQAWCDAGGVFVNGWVHAGALPVRKVSLQTGADYAETGELTARPDVALHYPMLPPGGGGFALYMACDALTPVTLTAHTDQGPGSASLHLARPTTLDGVTAQGATDAFIAAIRDRSGTVLELGARVVGSMTENWRSKIEPPCRYLGNDIHPSPGIDLVGDAHTLTAHVAPGTLDGVYSIAVLEHLAALWRAAAEINPALRLAGETLHITHQTWPMHETPNDFFRMSDRALRSLFGPSNGFKVLDCAMAYPVTITPPPGLRHAAWLFVPQGRGYGQSYIRARKVAEAPGWGAAWGEREMAEVSRAYPLPV